MLRLADTDPVIVYYHAVSEEPLPHVAPLYRHKTPGEFEADLDWLLGQLPPLGIDSLLAVARGEPGRRGFFVTFDDGLREVAEVAASILRRKGVPAAVFLNPPFLDNAALFYRFKAALLLGRLPGVSAAAREEARGLLAQPSPNIATLSQALRAVSYRDRGILDGVAAVFGVDFQAYLRQQRPYLTRQQAARLQREGWSLGAHSLDHPLYAEIPFQEQLRQTRESLLAVDEAFEPPHRLFAFPFTAHGVDEAFYTAARDSLKIEACFGTGGWFHEPARRLLQRVSLEGDKPTTGRFLRQSLGMASLMAWWHQTGPQRLPVSL